MNKKPRFQLKSKHILGLMTLLCISMIVAAFSAGFSTQGMRETAGNVIVPFEKAINSISGFLLDLQQDFQDKQKLQEENQRLQEKVDTLTAENNALIQQQTELERLKELYDLDQSYDQYPKVMAEIISKDPGNWYNTFIINKGTADGIQKDANVLAGGGLVGIVTEASSNWSTVRSIIDDSSNVSAMTTSTADTCIIEGSLQLIDEGKMQFSQLHDEKDEIQVGERIVTSNISDKFLEGIFVGYVSDIAYDDNNLTKRGTIVSPVDFRHLREVLVITTLKQNVESSDTAQPTEGDGDADPANGGEEGAGEE